MNNDTYSGGQPGKLSIKDLDALRSAALQFRSAGDTITGLQANTSIASAVSGGLPGTDTEKGVTNVDETLKAALKNQGQWLDDLSGKLLDQIAQVDQSAAAGLAQDAPAPPGGPAASGDGDAGGAGAPSSGGGSGSGGGRSGGGSGSKSGSPSSGAGSGGGSGAGSQPDSAQQGQPSGAGQATDVGQPDGEQQAAQPVGDQSGDGDTMSPLGPDGREVKLSPDQTKNAKAIMEEGKRLGVGGDEVQSALQTALREGGLHNFGNTDYPESLQYADKKPDGTPWLSDSKNVMGIFPNEGAVHADIQTMMDPHAQAAHFFQEQGFQQHALTGGGAVEAKSL